MCQSLRKVQVEMRDLRVEFLVLGFVAMAFLGNSGPVLASKDTVAVMPVQSQSDASESLKLLGELLTTIASEQSVLRVVSLDDIDAQLQREASSTYGRS